MVIVQFESAEAIDRADEIFAVEGVDMALFGTNDLTADMGIPGDYENPQRARRLCARDRGGEEARQACRRRRACARGRSSPPNSSRWARATSRPARISGFLLGAATEQARQVRALET